MIHLLSSPAFYIGLLLLSMILSPKQWIAIIRRLLVVLIYIAFYAVMIPLTIAIATVYGVHDAVILDPSVKSARREELMLLFSKIDRLGKNCVKLPFLLTVTCMLKTPLIGHATKQGIRDSKHLQKYLATSQFNPSHPLTVWRPVRSFMRLIPLCYRRGYNYRRHRTNLADDNAGVEQETVLARDNFASTHNAHITARQPGIVPTAQAPTKRNYPTAQQIQRIMTTLP